PDLWKFRRQFLDELTQPQLDSVGLAKTWMHFVEEAGKEAGAQRRRAALVLRLLVSFLEAALSLGTGGTPRLADREDTQALQALLPRTDPERLLELLERCLEAELQIDRRVQLVLVLEALLDALGQRLRVALAS